MFVFFGVYTPSGHFRAYHCPTMLTTALLHHSTCYSIDTPNIADTYHPCVLLTRVAHSHRRFRPSQSTEARRSFVELNPEVPKVLLSMACSSVEQSLPQEYHKTKILSSDGNTSKMPGFNFLSTPVACESLACMGCRTTEAHRLEDPLELAWKARGRPG